MSRSPMQTLIFETIRQQKSRTPFFFLEGGGINITHNNKPYNEDHTFKQEAYQIEFVNKLADNENKLCKNYYRNNLLIYKTATLEK